MVELNPIHSIKVTPPPTLFASGGKNFIGIQTLARNVETFSKNDALFSRYKD
ncbi:MAG: hypothetical protein UY62_C0071G0007 [Parcubacteria group bacterium GW2011_GWF2_50_9]|nr:MAG: hypothetical protein UY62_C0071G0007 [Parcubacteria group bacterium GW2011_GWF2_50_9]